MARYSFFLGTFVPSCQGSERLGENVVEILSAFGIDQEADSRPQAKEGLTLKGFFLVAYSTPGLFYTLCVLGTKCSNTGTSEKHLI